MGKGGYGTVDFWDEYYVVDRPEPYDWFFSCNYLSPLLLMLIDKTQEILMVGCGNAPFSEEMFDLGYQSQINVDNCALVIEQQLQRAPHMIWEIADVRAMSYESGRFGVVFDKGLLDNLYCYRDPEENAKAAVIEMYRTLKPGGMFVVLSCHDEEEVQGTLSCDPVLQWHDKIVIRLRNPRFPSTRVSFYTMVVALKSFGDDTLDQNATDKLPSVDLFMNLLSPEDGSKICVNEQEAEEMKLKTESLNAESRVALLARQEEIRRTQESNAIRQAEESEQFDDALEGSNHDDSHEPPNGSLAQQLSMRRGSLRKVELPIPPPLSAMMGNENETK